MVLVESAPAPADDLDISFADLAPVERTFVGRVTIDMLKPGNFGTEWHLAVEPISFRLNSATGSFHCFPKIKYTSAGKLSLGGEFGKVGQAIRSVFGDRNDDGTLLKPGKGQLVGKVAVWALRTLEYGKDKTTGEVIRGKRESLIALRLATKAEMENAAQAGSPVATPSAPTYTDAEVTVLEQILLNSDGLVRPASEYTRGIARRADLSPELKNAILSGAAAEYLAAN